MHIFFTKISLYFYLFICGVSVYSRDFLTSHHLIGFWLKKKRLDIYLG